MSETPDICIVITTFKRQELLSVLMESIAALKTQPRDVIVCDNENSPETKQLVNSFGWNHYIGMEENTGGAGGFSRGIEEAYKCGHEWIWVMDDDVAVLPDAIDLLSKWMEQTERDFAAGKPLSDVVAVYQGSKFNWDDSYFYWQYHFMNRLGIPNPVAPSGFEPGETHREMNTMCFEGSLINRRVVEAIGLPDARFFIYWDDTMYGYLASKVTKMYLVTDYVMRRTREIANVKIGKIRKLNSTGNLSRYHIMRNRGHMAHYLMINGDYNPVIFQFGTFLTYCKEVIRLFVSHEFKTGYHYITDGMRDGKVIRKQKDWKPFNEVHPLPKSSE